MGFRGADTSVLMSGGPLTLPLEFESWQDFNTPHQLQFTASQIGGTEALASQPGMLHSRRKENAHSDSN